MSNQKSSQSPIHCLENSARDEYHKILVECRDASEKLENDRIEIQNDISDNIRPALSQYKLMENQK